MYAVLLTVLKSMQEVAGYSQGIHVTTIAL